MKQAGQRLIRRITTAILALGVTALLVTAIWAWHPLPSNPNSTSLRTGSTLYSAEIIRDEWGVPHIFGTRDADTAFGVGYAHAEDDFETIQEVVAATRGVLARYRGLDGAATDYVVNLLGIWDTVEIYYDDQVGPETKAIAEAYAAGLNLYASENPDAIWAGLAPFMAEDIIAGFVLKTPFFYGLDETLLELLAETRDAALATPPQQQAWLLNPTLNLVSGSNAFAVAPTRSADGVTRLLINSHQPMTGPVAWWEAHLVSQQGLDIQGGLFPGSPVILHGFNRHLGWANTVSKPDLVDVYRLRINPENPNQYWLDGAWAELERDTAELSIKLFGPFAANILRPVFRSVHGPVIRAPHGTYAIRYAGISEVRQLDQYYALNKSHTWPEFYAAMKMNALPSINYVYADRTGHIALIHNGQFPERIAGWDWTSDLPGDRSDLAWRSYLPFDQAPKLVAPESGFVFNSNNQPYSATDGPDNLTPDMFPASMGLQTNETNRSLRILELVNPDRPISRDDLLAIKFDTGIAKSSLADQFIQEVLDLDWTEQPELQHAQAHLRNWNYQSDLTNRHAALGNLTTLRYVTAEFTGDPGPPPAAAFQEAYDWLLLHHGRIDPEWGDVNRLLRGDLNLPVSGGPDLLRAIYPAEISDDGQLKANAGDTWIALVEWRPNGQQTAQSVHQYGTATMHPGSPHYSDQAPLFATEAWRTVSFDRADIEARSQRTYRIGAID